MQEKLRVRIKSLSTRYLNLYKGLGYLAILSAGGGLIALLLYNLTRKLFLSLSLIQWFYIIYLWWRVNERVYNVEFDDEFLYVLLRKNDILIPLENIKDVNIVTLGGVYRVDLYNPEQLGDKIYFKPSLLYPFNHKKKDELVNVLWNNIEKAKQKKQIFLRNALHS